MLKHTHHLERPNDPVVLDLDEAAVTLKARHADEARRWIMSFAPESIVFYRPLRVSRELLVAAIARGARPQVPGIPEVHA